jgi:MFS transporter, PAT family, beta-lactamase induction signal transducer AmpG
MGLKEGFQKNASTVAGIFRDRKVATLVALGFASGLPLFLTRSTLQAWMTDEGVSLTAIALFAWVGFPYSLKFVWAPLLDRYQVPFLGRRRGWIFLTQLGLLFSLAALGALSPRSEPLPPVVRAIPGFSAIVPLAPSDGLFLIALVALMVAFFSASQDIIADGYRADLLTKEELGPGTTTFLVGYRIAYQLVATALTFLLADYFMGTGMGARESWRLVYWLMAGLMGIGLVGTLIAPEPKEVAKPPQSLSEAVVKPFGAFFRRQGSILILLFIALYGLADALLGIATPFYKSIGFTNTDIGTINKATSFIASIVGVSVGGILVAKIGMRRSLWIAAFAIALSNLAFIALAVSGKDYTVFVATVAIDSFCTGVSQTAFIAFLLSLCDKSYSVTQYALFTSASSLVGRFLSGASGYLVETQGWSTFFVITTLAGIPGVILLALLPKGLFGDPAAEEARVEGGVPAPEGAPKEAAARG